MARLERDREFLLRLLGLGEVDDLESFLEHALAMCMDVTGSSQGYLEIRDEFETDNAVRLATYGLDSNELEGAQARVSHGIVAEALATGSLICTDSASADGRFEARASVKAGRIEAVLCAPIGGRLSRGVVYLQNPIKGGVYSSEDCEMAEAFARYLEPFADRLLTQQRLDTNSDATAELRRRFQLDNIIGSSRALADVLEQATLAAPVKVTVLLTGASGTGKTQLARVIHGNSGRASQAFVELNCAAIPSELFESELFGARAGGHSTATRDIQGKVAAAEGGTLFLDEISELPTLLQAKLLQLLQSKEYYPLGASKPVRADIRVIAATNANLMSRVADDTFREDLFFRLNVMPIEIPGLAERRSDLRELSAKLLKSCLAEFGLPNVTLSVSALHAIQAAEWPGNVRQLENALQAAAIRVAGHGRTEVAPTDLFPDATYSDKKALTFQTATRDFQRDLLTQVLVETDWNVRATAVRLDIARSYVYQLIQAYEMKRSDLGE